MHHYSGLVFRFHWRWFVLIFYLFGMATPCLGVSPCPVQEEILTEAEANAFFMEQVKPILDENCLTCHGEDPEDLSGELAITSPESLFRGGESGPAVNADRPESSLLLKAIHYDVLEMPPDGKLPDESIAVLTRWVKLGIPWPESERTEVAPAQPKMLVTEEARQWWAFQPTRRVEPPVVVDADWCRNEIDRFVMAKLEANDMQPAPPAARARLIRRAYYDLIGLPPTIDEVNAFVHDDDPEAYPKLIDRLLSNPHYGEKWGRHWLDLVRYAESNSFERDGTKPFVWRYRDYVIRAFNDDKPYNQFLLEQLAGDELPNPTPEQLIATGYYRLGQWDDEPADPLQARFDELDDILATTGQTMLGLTVNCARCHDHKIDPVPQEDYYRMLAFINNVRHYGVRSDESVRHGSLITIDDPKFAEDNRRIEQGIAEIETQMEAMEAKAKEDFEPVEHQEFQNPGRRVDLIKKRVGKVITQEEFDVYMKLREKRRQETDRLNSQRLDILCVKEEGAKAKQTHVMIRGNPHVEGAAVDPGFVSVLSPPDPDWQPREAGQTTGLRLALAEWIASPENPLTARVMANRIWQYHFGRGIVRTSSDFGFQGMPPTHPELLDWLAAEFVDHGWSLKHMHRKIMLSAAYQMSSQYSAENYERDPENNLMWRFDMRRLTGEEIRDSILYVSGTLNLDRMYGPSVYPRLPAEVLAGQSIPGNNWNTSSTEDGNRRSIYVHVKRSLKVPILANYDAPDADFTCPVRFVTTQPSQALNMVNSEFIHEQATALRDSLGYDGETALTEIVTRILKRVCQRVPETDEIELGVSTIEAWMREDSLPRDEAIRQYCLLALNLNEFVYVE
jgi:mono/diheme cytochrome c family protein